MIADKHILRHKEAFLHDFTKNMWAKIGKVNLVLVDPHNNLCEDYIAVKIRSSTIE